MNTNPSAIKLFYEIDQVVSTLLINPMYCSDAAYINNITITQSKNNQVLFEIILMVVIVWCLWGYL